MPRLLLSVLVLVLAGCASAVDSAVDSGKPRVGRFGLVEPPTQVAPADVSGHIGSLVTLRAHAGAGRVESGRIVFPVVGDEALQIVVVPPLLSASSQEIIDRFSGREVYVIGRVTDLGGQLEVFTGDPGRIQLVSKEEGS